MRRSQWAVGALAGLVLLLGACGGGGGGSEKQDDALSVEQKDGGGAGLAAAQKLGLGAALPGGRILADSGFRSDRNGLPFPNYPNGPGITNLTPDDLRSLWGDGVCSALVDGACTLSPPAALIMDELNAVMDGGHCFGLSVASLLMAEQQLDPKLYGAPTVAGLVFDGNTALQRRIALGFIYQVLDSVRAEALVGAPNAILDFLRNHLKDRSSDETYTIGIHLPDGSGGHAVTPYAVVDRGQGRYGVQIYDNNFPGEAREISFDRKKNSWSYFASPNPDEPGALYEGDDITETMELFPTKPALGPQPCPFCNGELGPALAEPALGQVFVSGNDAEHPRIVLTDSQGRRTGYVKGKLLKEIPGVKVEHRYYASDGRPAGEPVYKVPLDAGLTVTLDGAGLDETADAKVGFVGQGFSVAVDDLEFEPGQKDKLTLPGGGNELSYTPGGEQSPTFEVGADFAGTDFAFQVDANDVAKGSTFSLDLGDDRLGIDTTGKAGAFDVAIRRIDPDGGEELFDHDGLKLSPDAQGQLEYEEFSESGQTVTFEVEQKDGTVKEQELRDENEDDAKPQPEPSAPEPSGSTATTSTTAGSAPSTTTTAPDGGPTTTTTAGGARGSTTTTTSSPTTTSSTGPGREPAGGDDAGDPAVTTTTATTTTEPSATSEPPPTTRTSEAPPPEPPPPG